jgi:hypothetical protein
MRGSEMFNLFSSALTFRKATPEKLVFIGLNLLDLILTLLSFSLGLTELNPIVIYLYTNPIYIWVAKFAIPVIIAWVIPGKLLIPAISLLALVIGWDVKELIIFFLN